VYSIHYVIVYVEFQGISVGGYTEDSRPFSQVFDGAAYLDLFIVGASELRYLHKQMYSFCKCGMKHVK